MPFKNHYLDTNFTPNEYVRLVTENATQLLAAYIRSRPGLPDEDITETLVRLAQRTIELSSRT